MSLAPLSSDPADEETVLEHPSYRIARRRTGDFLLFRISGRFTPDLLDALRSKVFLYKANYALEVSGLKGVTAAFAREIRDTAESFRSGQKRIVLVGAPEALRSLLAMAGRSSVEVVASEDQLVGETPKADENGAHVLRELERMRKEFQSNRHWQFVDREGCWICPYCGGLQEDVRFSSPLAVASATVEKAYRHVWTRCPAYRPASPALRPLRELEEVLRRANQDKVLVRRGQMDRMESELAALKGRTQELEEHVQRASERQRRLLPAKAPDVPGTEIDLIYRPAAVVSGDFYDFVPLDDGKIAFLVGDVSGHGIEAGIVMGMAKKVLSLRLQDFADPIEALSRTNADVDRELGRVSFVTAFVAVYDPAARSLTCVRAGHNPPLLYNPRRDGRCLLLQPGGLGLGILGSASFEPTLETLEVPVQPGDLLLLYTDGLTEAHNPQGEQFGVERTLQALEATYGYSPALILSHLAGALDGFTGRSDSEDDITAVCIRFR